MPCADGSSAAGKQDLEHASALSIARKLNVPAVRLNRPASDCETQPYTTFLPGAASVDAIEAIENTIPMRCGNSRSSISHLDHGPPGIHRVQFDADRAAVRRVFYRIVNQIHEGMVHERSVPDGMNCGRGPKREILVLFVGQHAELIDDISRQRHEVQGLRRQLNPSRVGARKGQKTLDKAREPVDLLQHAADDVAVRAGIECVPQRYLAHAAHRSQRGAQLVRRIGRETTQPFERILQTR